MNRHRTTPGLGPSKAGASTRCQKCLALGHYSYECKASLQSRPYATRASRSQQLRNPKLKPTLTETKLSEPSSPIVAKATVESEQEPAPAQYRGRSRSIGQEPPTKRRRRSVSSASISSTSSVATISTQASESRRDGSRQARDLSISEPRRSRSRSISSLDRGKGAVSPTHRAEPAPPTGRPHADGSTQHHRSQSRDAAEQQHTGSYSPQHGNRVRSPKRRERSPNPDAGTSRRARSGFPPSHSKRERSLSPYSRRLALTHAMNASQ